MSTLEIFLIIIIIIILVVIAVLTSAAAVRITSIKNFQSNLDLRNAHQKLTVASIVGWIAIIIYVFIIVYYLSKHLDKRIETSGEAGIRLSIFITAILIFIEGILAAVASTDMDKAKASGIDATGARSLSNTAAILGILGGVLAIVVIISSLIPKKKPKVKGEEEKEGEEEEVEEAAIL